MDAAISCVYSSVQKYYGCRYLHILGQLSRFGADLLDGREHEGGLLQLADCLQTAVSFFDRSEGECLMLA